MTKGFTRMKTIQFTVALVTLMFANISIAASFYTDQTIFNSLATTTLVEDFEAFSPKAVGFSQFTSNGITYTSLSGTNLIVASPGYTNFGVPVTTSSVLTAHGVEHFKLNFSMPVNAISFDTYLNNFGPATITVYGDSGAQLDSYALDHPADTVGFLGITSNVNIASIVWQTIGGDVVNTGIDNISIGSYTATPIPAAAFLFTPALLGFIGFRRKLGATT